MPRCGLESKRNTPRPAMRWGSRPAWAGPALGADFGVAGEPDDIMEACFDDMLCGQGEGTGWRQHRETAPDAVDSGASHARKIGDTASFHIKGAILWGGNLSVLSSLVGTPYCPSVQGGILFLEDVAEHPYRLERMLTQLLNAGIMSKQKAVVLGQFTDYKLSSHDKGFKLQSVIQWLRRQIKAPVLTNLPFGHVPTKVLLPVGAKTDLVVQGRDALLLWGHEM